jgi:hypothetical protein
MLFRKIFEGRVYSQSNGNPGAIKLPVSKGGSMCKIIQYMVKTFQTSGTNTRVTVEVFQGPDATTFTSAPLATPVNAGNPGATLPSVLVGDTGAAVVGEFLLPVVSVSDSAAPSGQQQWAWVEVYELRKPF